MSETIAALTAAVKAAPTNTLLPLVLADALDEAGETVEAMALRVQAEVNAKTKRAARIRTMIRDEVGLGFNVRAQITVIAGDAAPVKTGRSYHWTTKTGIPVRYPSAYSRAYGNPIYHASTIGVTVGAEWVAARIKSI